MSDRYYVYSFVYVIFNMCTHVCTLTHADMPADIQLYTTKYIYIHNIAG